MEASAEVLIQINSLAFKGGNPALPHSSMPRNLGWGRMSSAHQDCLREWYSHWRVELKVVFLHPSCFVEIPEELSKLKVLGSAPN